MTDSKIIDQIRQLLRIASDRGTSINERELAQRRAERLMVRHRIETLPEGEAGGQRDGYASGIGWMGERLDGPRVGIAASLPPQKETPMNRIVRPLVGLLLITLVVLSVMSGGSAARVTDAASNTPAPPVLTGWVGADSRLQWSLSWTPEPGGGLVDVTSDSEDVYPGVTCRTDAGREITLQGTQEDVNRVSVRIPAGVARCDAYMGGRPAARTRRMFNNVAVGGRAVVGVIDRSDPREA